MTASATSSLVKITEPSYRMFFVRPPFSMRRGCLRSLPVRSRCEADVDLFVRQLSHDRLLSHDTVDDYPHALDGHDLVPNHDLFFMKDHVDDSVSAVKRCHFFGRLFVRTDRFPHYTELLATDRHCDRSFFGDDDLLDSDALDGYRDRVSLELLLG
jgi:hypothetical protein